MTEPGRRRRSDALLVAVAALLILGLGAFGLSQLAGPPAGASYVVAVPDVAGQPQAQAELALHAVGLVPRVRMTPGKDDKSVGTVVNQDPGAADKVIPGSTVTLMVNGGPTIATLPGDLVGRPVQEVERLLKKLGFTDVSTQAVSAGDGVKPGEVMSVKPAEGKQIALDAAIRIRFARGGGGGAAVDPTSDKGTRAPQAPAPRTSDEPTTSAERDDEPAGGQNRDDDGALPPRAPVTRAPTAGAPTTAPTTAPTRRSEPTAPNVPPAQNPTRAPQPQPTTTEQADEDEDEDDEEEAEEEAEEADDDKDKKGKGKGKGRGRGQGD